MANFVELICPRCQQTVAEDRTTHEVIVCNHCGYTHSRRDEELENRHERRLTAIVLVGALLAVFSFVHYVQWDKYSIQIIPLKVKQLTHTASTTDLKQIAHICLARMKYSCTETALSEVMQKNPNDTKTLYKLADLQRRLGQSDEAMASFKQYFALGGVNPDADFGYARVLASSGRYNKAQVYFQRTLLSKPGIVQITVTQSYVDMLMKMNKTKEAISLIQDVRRRTGPEGETFMAREYNEMTQHQF